MPETTGAESFLTITERAAEKAKASIEEKKDAIALRVFVVGGGCSGYQYGMSLALKPAGEDDVVVQERGVSIFVDKESIQHLNGAEIDYIEDLMKSGFTIYNPNATSSCACGSSFQTREGGGTPRPCA